MRNWTSTWLVWSSILPKLIFSKATVKCINQALKFYKAFEYSMKLFVYSKSIKYDKPREQTGYLSALKDLDRIVYITKHQMCPKGGAGNSKFTETFDDLYSGASKYSAEDSYCLRWFVVSNNYVEQVDGVDLNPGNLDLFNINCDGRIATLRKSCDKEFTFVHNQSELQQQCVNNRLADGEYFENFAVALTLKDLGSPEGEVKKQKNIFRKIAVREFKSVMECGDIEE